MTESEAKAILERDLNCLKQNKALPDSIEAMEIAINALEKQLTKKVNLRHIRKYDGFDDGECPNCGMSVSRDCDGDDVFCPDCGQKLDWSDKE